MERIGLFFATAVHQSRIVAQEERREGAQRLQPSHLLRDGRDIRQVKQISIQLANLRQVVLLHRRLLFTVLAARHVRGVKNLIYNNLQILKIKTTTKNQNFDTYISRVHVELCQLL